MTKTNIIWKTDEDPTKIGECEIVRNIEVGNTENGYVEVRVTQQTLLTDEVSLPKLLTPIEAITMAGALLKAAQPHLEAHR